MTPIYAVLNVEKPRQTSMLTDGKLHIYVCGTGDPEISMQEVRKPSCLAIIADNQFLLIFLRFLKP